MMFDEAQVFKGLSAWFSASVPTKFKCQWVKNGGNLSNDFNDADYIFSSNAAVKDTMRIFDSQTYQREELTVFHSSLIEDTVANGKSCLSGKYAGTYILIHPAYQREIDSFRKKQCPRLYGSNVKLSNNEDGKESGPDSSCLKAPFDRMNFGESINEESSILWHQDPRNNGPSDEWDFIDETDTCTSENPKKLQIGGLFRQQQISEEEHSDEWDFKDDSNLCINNLFDTRKQTKTITQSDKSSASQLKWNSPTVKRTRLESLSKEGEVTLNLARKGRSHCFQGESDRNSHSENLSKPQMCNEDFSCREDQRKSGLCLMGIEERESSLDESWVKNNAASVAPANLRSKFLSSMDDGFVHIDDINLPESPIYDFIPNQNGCRVDAK